MGDQDWAGAAGSAATRRRAFPGPDERRRLRRVQPATVGRPPGWFRAPSTRTRVRAAVGASRPCPR
jgi:hypothetical protein